MSTPDGPRRFKNWKEFWRAIENPPGATGYDYALFVGIKSSQAEALAAFADMQRNYPDLLAKFPLVQKVDLASKRVGYRLLIGPISDEAAAFFLCNQLKSKGLDDCQVMKVRAGAAWRRSAHRASGWWAIAR